MKRRILSLDGGGSWALLQAMALKAVYNGSTIGTKCGDILNHFDLIVANSGGSIMLAAMIENADKDITDVLSIIDRDDIRNGIFSKLKPRERGFEEWVAALVKVGPRYKTSRKTQGFEKALPQCGNVKMVELRAIRKIPENIVICGFDYDRSRSTFFRTNKERSKGPNDVGYLEHTLINAINAASNAPVQYFDEPARFIYGGRHHRYWDGAVGGYNNPILVGITEALAVFEGSTVADFDILSIGTANTLLPVNGFTVTDSYEVKGLVKEIKKSGLAADVRKMSESIISEPPDAANYMAHIFLGGVDAKNSRPAFVRLNPFLMPELVDDSRWVIPKKIGKDDEQDFMYLLDLDMDATDRADIEKIKKLGQWWIGDKVYNQPIRYDSFRLECKIGHSRFSAGKDDWRGRTGIDVVA
jgi:uncharacterized protein